MFSFREASERVELESPSARGGVSPVANARLCASIAAARWIWNSLETVKKLLVGLAVALLALVAPLLRPAGEAAAPDAVARPEASAEPAAQSVEAALAGPETVRTDANAREESWSDVEKVHGLVIEAVRDRPVAQLAIDGALEGRGVRRARTDAQGRFTLEVKPGLVRVTATPPDHAGWCEHIVLERGRTASFTRELGGAPLPLQAWTSRGDALEPLEGAEVRVVAVNDDAALHIGCPIYKGAPTASTDARGQASFTTLAGAIHLVQVRAEGHHSRTFVLDLERRAIEYSVEVVLEPIGAPIRGRILTPEGQPLAGALVMIDIRRNAAAGASHFAHLATRDGQPKAELEAELHPPFVATGPDGRYEIHGPRRNSPGLLDATLLVFPQRDGLVHHHSLPLPTATLDLARDLDVRLPVAHEITVEFVNPDNVALKDGPASARGIDGRAFAPEPRFIPGQQLTQTAGRYFATENGIFRFLHAGGTVRVGLSPGGVWRGQEIGIVIPSDGSKRFFHLTLPY